MNNKSDKKDSALEKVRCWLKGYKNIPQEFAIDYTSKIPGNIGLFPGGLVEVERIKDIRGNVRLVNQYNFAIYCVFPFTPGIDESATANAEWVIDFQNWVQKQSIMGLAPTFGNYQEENEIFTAQNGAQYELDEEGTTALYVVLLSAQFQEKVRRSD